MAKNSGINARTLSNRELVRYATLEWDSDKGLTVNMQRELLRRFAEQAPMNEHPVQDEKQKDLFLQ